MSQKKFEKNYEKLPDLIIVYDRENFNPRQILECGQIFTYEKTSNGYTVFSRDKIAKISDHGDCYLIETKDVDYFENFFDLKTDYGEIKKKLSKYEILKRPIEFGQGIRIIKQDLFDVMISFIISANNNIKRIQKILNRVKEKFGSVRDGYIAMPTKEDLLKASEKDFEELGAGYRAKYLYNAVRQFDRDKFENWRNDTSDNLRKNLIQISGVGPKVADCIMLFGYGKQDVFPVDIWMKNMYEKYYHPEENRKIIAKNLTDEFGNLSGYAQQYLYYYMISGES